MSTSRNTAKEAASLVDQYGFVGFIRQVILGGIIYQIGLRIIEGFDGLGAIVFGIPTAIGYGMIGLIEAIFGGLEAMFGASTATAVRSFAEGTASLLGPFAQPFAVGMIMLSVGVFIWSLNRLSISPLTAIQSVR